MGSRNKGDNSIFMNNYINLIKNQQTQMMSFPKDIMSKRDNNSVPFDNKKDRTKNP